MKAVRILAVILLCVALLAGVYKGGGPADRAGIQEYTTLTLFSDVDHWKLPPWSLEEGSITGRISEHTGVVIDAVIPPQEADKQLSLMLLDDRLPDIISVTSYPVIRQMISSGKVWRMDKFLEAYCPDSHLLKDFPDDIRKRLTEEFGGWYSYPSNMNSEGSRSIWKNPTGYYDELFSYQDNMAIIWNRKILDMAGIDPARLSTKSQVLAAFELVKNSRLTVNGQEVIPLLLDGKHYQEFSLRYLNNSFGAECVDGNGNYMDRMRQPQCRESLEFLNRALRSRYVQTECLTYDNAQVRAQMAKGNVFCFIGNAANTGIDAREWISTGAVQSEYGSRPVLGLDLTVPMGWMQTLVSKDCKNPEAAARFLDYMTSDEGLLFTNFGTEGEDYIRGGDGFVRRTETGEQKYRENVSTGLGIWWNFLNDAWYNSLMPIPEEGSGEACTHAIKTAFGRESCIYNSGLLSPPQEFWEEHPKEAEIRDAVAQFQEDQIHKVIAARTDEEFEREYEALLAGQEEIGIVQLDEAINEQVQENFKRYGETVEKVN